jgi:SAM-dependent methyltransferase
MVDNSGTSIRCAVRQAYSEAADSPMAPHPFPVGRAFAESVGYPGELLNRLPSIASEAFAGVSNISITADIPTGSRVLDLGCGAGLDSLVASCRVGPAGEVIGVDFSDSMLMRARTAAMSAGFSNIRFCRGDAEEMPVPPGWADVVLANGIFNLNPARHLIFKELARVTRGGGVVFAAELILSGPLPSEVTAEPGNWFA